MFHLVGQFWSFAGRLSANDNDAAWTQQRERVAAVAELDLRRGFPVEWAGLVPIMGRVLFTNGPAGLGMGSTYRGFLIRDCFPTYTRTWWVRTAGKIDTMF